MPLKVDEDTMLYPHGPILISAIGGQIHVSSSSSWDNNILSFCFKIFPNAVGCTGSHTSEVQNVASYMPVGQPSASGR